jgi:hypothetical protein
MKTNSTLSWTPLDQNFLRYIMQYGQTREEILKWELYNAWQIFRGEINEIILALIKNNLNGFFPTAPVELHDTLSRKDT